MCILNQPLFYCFDSFTYLRAAQLGSAIFNTNHVKMGNVDLHILNSCNNTVSTKPIWDHLFIVYRDNVDANACASFECDFTHRRSAVVINIVFVFPCVAIVYHWIIFLTKM